MDSLSPERFNENTLWGLSDRYYPLRPDFAEAQIKRELNINKVGGFRAYSRHFRKKLLANIYIKDQGAIDKDIMFPEHVPCAAIHPGLCRACIHPGMDLYKMANRFQDKLTADKHDPVSDFVYVVAKDGEEVVQQFHLCVAHVRKKGPKAIFLPCGGRPSRQGRPICT